MTVISLASTAATLAGNLMGRGETLVVMPMVGKVVKTGYVLLLPMTILIAVFADPVMSVFTSDYTLHEASRGALYVLLVSYFFTVPGQILFYVVSGTGNTRTALAFEFISLFIYTTYVVIACYYLRLDLTWCWASEAVYSFFILILSFLYLRYGRWQLKKI